MSPKLDDLRFGPERDLLGDIFQRFGLSDLVDHYITDGGLRESYEWVWSTHLRLNEVLSPRLSSLFRETLERLEFQHPAELFVVAESQINAFAVPAMDGTPHLVCLTSGLVERMDDSEIRFVLGHELGHLRFEHYKALLVFQAAGKNEDGSSRLPALACRRLETWQRFAELSADRAGMYSVDRDLDTVVSAFFKIASGLGPNHLRFDTAAFLNQLASVQELKRSDLLASFSHPITPVRVRALQLFLGCDPSAAGSVSGLDDGVLKLAMLMEREATTPLDVHARDFLLSGGVLAAQAGGTEITEDQWNFLVEWLLPVCADPETEFQRIHTVDDAQKLLSETTTWLQENAGQERFTLLRMMAELVAADGRVLPGEKSFIHRVAADLGIPEKAADDLVYEVLGGHLQSQAGRRPLRMSLAKTA